ncbi:bifunctional phosphopantothenoylcysteine decarboxylase/phosphopantothenate--cysteine ligase CoaBC [candidate division KSB1 bacterium]|nr:bifunctional phosphopantothenoylcysteine decarboxylase/phosphopantothenate--cysteine ligase CoaBC [candidate division KSB1 bacterium]
MLRDRHILLGVTGGIAAYKACEVVRALAKQQADVKVVMTQAATEFVSPLTFETLSLNPVSIGAFEKGTIHIDLARWADCILVCPATYNTINKVARGIADNLLTALIAASTVPVMFCPAMNKEMYANPIFQASTNHLRSLGYQFIDPEKGELACQEEGWGRLAATNTIIDNVLFLLGSNKALDGKKIIVTAGPTEEPLDPVRILTNRSSGKMGFALATSAALRGADVTLISGPNHLRTPFGVDYREIHTAAEMADEVMSLSQTADIVIMAAAVADYRPRQTAQQKIKKTDSALALELESTVDILETLGRQNKQTMLVGFALETENALEHALEKLRRKNLDLIIVNNALEPDAAFNVDSNRVTIINRLGETEELPLMSKADVAEKIMDRIITLVNGDDRANDIV